MKVQRIMVECRPRGAYDGASYELRQFLVGTARAAIKAARAHHYETRYVYVETHEAPIWHEHPAWSLVAVERVRS